MAGEMSTRDIEKGGEHYEWSQHIKFAALRLMRLTKKQIKLEKMRPFDVYQGPYACLNYGRLWSGETQNTFFYEGLGISVSGSIRTISNAINIQLQLLEAA